MAESYKLINPNVAVELFLFIDWFEHFYDHLEFD